MIFSLFGKKKDEAGQAAATDTSDGGSGSGDEGRFVRPMEPGDIPRVLEIIENHDEDDAEEAADDLRHSLIGMFVAIDNGRVVGVTGAIEDPEAEGVCWLSWTYVDEAERGQGMGRYLMEGLLHELSDAGIRKLFMSTGDYVEDGEDIYAAAKALYKKLGATLELKVDDFFEVGEARYVYGLNISDAADGNDAPAPAGAEQSGHLIFDGLHPIDETDDGISLTWTEFEGGSDKHPMDELQGIISEARGGGARFLVAAVPADLSGSAEKGLEETGFTKAGSLKDYYQPGIAQDHWVLRLDGAMTA